MNRKYRKTVIAGNWKMNKTPSETKEFMTQLKSIMPKGRWCDIALCVPAVCIPTAVRAMRETRVGIGAENCNANPSGAYTRRNCHQPCSPMRLQICDHWPLRAPCHGRNRRGCQRQGSGRSGSRSDSHYVLRREPGAAQQRYHRRVITMQIKLGLAGVPEDKIRKVIIAYEPIWAIGTGLTATPEQAEEVCEMIRSVVRKLYSSKNARAISILYGGSMNEKNAFELLAQPDIDGGLIGGASLVPEKFVKIIEAANQPTV